MNNRKEVVDDVLKMSVWNSVCHRLPWLLIGLCGGILTAHYINSFEEVLSQNLILASFIPLVVYISDAVGTQMEAFMIRDGAINRSINFLKYFLRQMLVVGVISFILSVGTYLFVLVIYGDGNLGLILSISLFLSSLSSVVTGLILPRIIIFRKIDPANASGPIATIIQDFMSVVIYFSVASVLLV